VTRRKGSRLPAAEKTRAAVAAAGITGRQLEYWVEKGWIAPDGPAVQGHPRSFSGAECAVMRTMARLTRAGFPAPAAAQIARRAVAAARGGEAAVPLAGGDLVIVIGDI
jgi:hypothetical protein